MSKCAERGVAWVFIRAKSVFRVKCFALIFEKRFKNIFLFYIFPQAKVTKFGSILATKVRFCIFPKNAKTLFLSNPETRLCTKN